MVLRSHDKELSNRETKTCIPVRGRVRCFLTLDMAFFVVPNSGWVCIKAFGGMVVACSQTSAVRVEFGGFGALSPDTISEHKVSESFFVSADLAAC